MTKITRSSTCGSLKLPHRLACMFCKPSLLKYEVNGKIPRRIKRCIRPFDDKWKDHRLHDKVDLYHSIIDYVTNIEDSTDTNTDDTNDSDDCSNISEELLPKEVTPQKDTTGPIPNYIPDLSNDTSTVHTQYGSSEGTEFSVDVPTSFRLIHISQLNRLKSKAEKYDQIIHQLSRSFYTGIKQADTLLGFAASLIPQCGFSGLATVIPLLISSVLMNTGIHIAPEKIVESLPSPQYLQSCVTKYAVETALLVRTSIEANPNVRRRKEDISSKVKEKQSN